MFGHCRLYVPTNCVRTEWKPMENSLKKKKNLQTQSVHGVPNVFALIFWMRFQRYRTQQRLYGKNDNNNKSQPTRIRVKCTWRLTHQHIYFDTNFQYHCGFALLCDVCIPHLYYRLFTLNYNVKILLTSISILPQTNEKQTRDE